MDEEAGLRALVELLGVRIIEVVDTDPLKWDDDE